MPRPLLPTLVALLGLVPTAALAVPYIEVIDRGVPTDGVRTMDGYRAFVVRLVSDDGPITRVELPSFLFGGIAGSLAQRWTDPSGAGDYTVTSPGFLDADNSTPTDLNFDTHLLGDPAHFRVTDPLGEDAVFGLFPRTGIPSTLSVGYGVTTAEPTDDPLVAGSSGHLFGAFDVLPAFQSDTLDLAYVVSDTRFRVDVIVVTPAGQTITGRDVVVPEPGAIATLLGAASMLVRRKRRRASQRPVLECLEHRRLLSVAPPTGVAASLNPTTNAVVVT